MRNIIWFFWEHEYLENIVVFGLIALAICVTVLFTGFLANKKEGLSMLVTAAGIYMVSVMFFTQIYWWEMKTLIYAVSFGGVPVMAFIAYFGREDESIKVKNYTVKEIKEIMLELYLSYTSIDASKVTTSIQKEIQKKEFCTRNVCGGYSKNIWKSFPVCENATVVDVVINASCSSADITFYSPQGVRCIGTVKDDVLLRKAIALNVGQRIKIYGKGTADYTSAGFTFNMLIEKFEFI